MDGMGIRLYEHNQTAYEKALAMLREKGRAAIVHPTGTGKSFIGFRLCEDLSDKAICWLSPSEYIFRTQIENLKTAGADAPENIRFFTYARLAMMDRAELEDLKPDCIILDEFHRCGASVWGQGVQDLLALYPKAPVLGLSATNIRYLDGQRDMAEELFDGNIASEMTLGEAIVRGILNPPRYILSTYSCQKELGHYQERARNARSATVRTEAEKYLEALRRALENAEGMDEVFARYMEEKHGRYLVFCAGYEHMQEMVQKVPEWFAKVDARPHVYTAYSEDPSTDRAFRAFKADESRHLKLLFCIDMLNEGVHVGDVSGVILLRPTVSPTIYKQQIGRALAAGAERDAVIFDVVMNIGNLYSIGTVEEEMRAAVQYYRERGESAYIVNEHFRVTGEAQDCVRLFARLNETLGASWELMYAMAERYYREHGDIEVPKRYVTGEGFSLGQWLDTQRKVRAGKAKGTLTEEQAAKLDRLGMRWQGKADAVWEKYYAAAKKYYAEHGDLLASVRNGKYEGLDLGRWLAQLRMYKKGGIKGAFLTPERIAALDGIGMVWDVPDYLWEQNYAAAVRYHRRYGDLDVPSGYVDEDGVRLGAWISNLRSGAGNRNSRRAELTEEQTARLNELGMCWGNKYSAAWEKSYEALCRYRREHGDINIPNKYVTEDGYRLGRWVSRQREACRGNISEERRRKLEKVGI